ncbi:hypothetical protein [Herbidospora cretacea]|uniref:hypothetical protein n=1 Tax=Herbidospora cretacea TaxID=28444 RepID=UPI0012FA1F5E|nr:hypothetical protein [Herbidospora cretacea]
MPADLVGAAPEETAVEGASETLVPGAPVGALVCAHPGTPAARDWPGSGNCRPR